METLYSQTMLTQYTGNMDGAIVFSAAKPFAVAGWPSDADVETFDTEQEARDFILRFKKSHPFLARLRLYGFSESKWIRL